MTNLGNKKRLTEDIVIYENFLTEEESSKLIEVLDNVAKNGTLTWMPISFYESYSSTLPDDGDEEILKAGLDGDIFSKIKSGIVQAVASVHDIDPNTVSQIGYHTQKWEPGAFARLHSDNTDEHGNTGPFARSRYAAFLYLNDDFGGGMLKFPQQGLEIAPKAGMLAAFDGGFNNMHEVTLIESGVRYTIGSFWDDREEDAYPQEVRDAWAEEMKKIREAQEVERKEWQDFLKDGYKLDMDGKPYKLEEQAND
jgi:hypothetical protein